LTAAPTLSLSWQRKLAHDELYSAAQTRTPYGSVCHDTVAQGKDGPLTIFHVNPFAMLFAAAESSKDFSKFVADTVAATSDGLLSLVYYIDKA
jgi:hypothetical protein